MNTLVRSTGTERVRIDTVRAVAAGLAARAIATLRAWARRSRTRGELAELDDAMLRDLGVARANANFEASKPFWQP
ncbi:DUF1127 domain-containing protein [Aromatoleum toluolicum]|uniref:DUF1127 domain-containing protein n=1 Tax=Aromatoleum toluolicum TaxID=90060 RepID=A0ABX1NHZ5_9RHOO|nr:DUF1127 domain-containing protein [Aromatoleum toluolicum]NMF98922.1 DUF1127 domain-containing protein [Aromatoleum toluolicum]